MAITKRTLDLQTRPLLRLSEIELIIDDNRLIIPPPSRRALTEMCEDGRLKAAPRRNGRGPYLVYEDSFLAWIASLMKEGEA